MEKQFDEILTTVNDNLTIAEKREGLRFGTDALLLAAFIRRQKNKCAAELGSGTGIISLLCARRKKFSHICAYEIQEAYASLTAQNVERNGLSDCVETVCADIRTVCDSYDVVFSNPPYMKAGAGDDSADAGRQAARHTVNGDIDDFCAAAARMLHFGGLFYVVYRPDRLVDLLCALRAHKLEPKRMRFVMADETHAPSLVLIEAKKGAAPSLLLPQPFYLNRNQKESAEMRAVRESGDM